MSDMHTNNGSSRPLDDLQAVQLTAYALGQLEGREQADIERLLAEPGQEEARRIVAATKRIASQLPAAIQVGDASIKPSESLRAAVLCGLGEEPVPAAVRSRGGSRWMWLVVGGGVACCVLAISLPAIISARKSARNFTDINTVEKQLESVRSAPAKGDAIEGVNGRRDLSHAATSSDPHLPHATGASSEIARSNSTVFEVAAAEKSLNGLNDLYGDRTAPLTAPPITTFTDGTSNGLAEGEVQAIGEIPGQTEYFHNPTPAATVTDPVPQRLFRSIRGIEAASESLVTELETTVELAEGRTVARGDGWANGNSDDGAKQYGTEQYERIVENLFLAPTEHALSTFSIDVDTASYANVRRFLSSGRLPPPNAVRLEEMVNYFTYSYPQPKGADPFSVNMEVAQCPWAEGHLLLRVGLKGKEVHKAERPASNLVFLIDVSGSMADENKLPLVKTAMSLFVGELTENDRVTIVTYAGDAGLRLSPTSGDQKQKILGAIDSLQSGGSTHGSAGIQLAYEQSEQYFIKGGTNRVILATDGDLNVGITDDDALVRLIKEKATGGTFLTVLGFGEGNLKDAKMEKLADNGNGMYAYIDGVREGRKVLVEQMTGSTITIAKDVKIQIEFNPAMVASYRLLGYENRVLAAQDFNDDKKDAGEIGAGHTVTALYELVPVGAKQDAAAPRPGTDPLKYQGPGTRDQEPGTRDREPDAVGNAVPGAGLTEAAQSGELLTLKLRYKEPEGQTSKLSEYPLKDRGGQFNAASKDLQFAAAVASFGMLLRNSQHKGSGNMAAVAEIATGSLGEDPSGYRAEFIDLVRQAQNLGVK